MTVDIYSPTPNDTLSLEEFALYNLIMEYRADNGLKAIPLSEALTVTAGRHATDLRANVWEAHLQLPPGSSVHSWSDAPYPDDNSNPGVMWHAPERLGTGFHGFGYEIAVVLQGAVSVQMALRSWMDSPGHNAVILNQAPWKSLHWHSIGVGIDRLSDGTTVMYVWFSETADANAARLLGTAADNSLTGTAFKDRILGGEGADSLAGSGGNDVLWGEAGNDSLSGGQGVDILAGGEGRDRLRGGEGADQFVFEKATRDVIRDFSASDVIVLKGAAFGMLGAAVDPSELGFGTTAQQAGEYLIYDQATGRLWFDADGDAGGKAALLAVLRVGADLSAGDFLIR